MTTRSAPRSAPEASAIRELPEQVAAQIAAGEVIERPAAVLKELLENAVDAGASRVTVEISGAGSERIAVHDDGAGIAEAEVALAFRRHATSKLAHVDDLARLESYGFRGEALPAIAAAAGRLRLTTRTAAANGATSIEFEAGVAQTRRAAARAVGTTVEVDDLFAGQPARRAFLAGARAERSAILRVASDTVLAHPEISLRLVVDGRTPLQHEAPPRLEAGLESGLESEAALRAAAASVFHLAAAERSVWLDGGSASRGLRLDGLAGSPDEARRRRDAIRLFVNRRPVHDRRLSYAVQEAYRDWLPAGAFPLVVARLQVPPEAVDVNIHPAKTEVKLRDAGAAFSLLGRTIREALWRDRYAVPRRLTPGLEFAEDAARSTPDGPEPSPRATTATGAEDAPTPIPRVAAPAPVPGRRAVAEAVHQPTLGPQPSSARLPPLRMVGQLHRTFIIAEGPSGLVLVDQHGAHERVIYERLLEAVGVGPERQPLLDPQLLPLDAAEAANWLAASERLAELGFEADLFGERTLRLRAVPASLAGPDGANAEGLIRAVLDDLGPQPDAPQRFDPVAASAACHGSVRRGALLDAQAMSSLLRELERCLNPHSCPHGRPTLVEISADDVLREFRRK